MTRPQGVVRSAAGLAPVAHAAWGYRDRAQFFSRAAEFIIDGLMLQQRVEFVSAGGTDSLPALLAAMPSLSEQLTAEGIAVTSPEDFYVFEPGTDTVAAGRTVDKCIGAVESAIAQGYKGYRVIVDVTPVAATPRQRHAVAVLEYLLDQKAASHPFSALCCYDIAQLGDGAAEMICLHPFIGEGSAMFRLYAEPDADMGLALVGEVDAACADAFAATIQRTFALWTGRTVRVAADGLEFIGHEQLAVLDRQARAHDLKIVLCTDQPIPTRLMGLLKLDNIQLEPGWFPVTDEAESVREELRQRDRQLANRPPDRIDQGQTDTDLGA